MKRPGSLRNSFTRYTKAIGRSSHAASTIFFFGLLALPKGLVGTLEMLTSEQGNTGSRAHDLSLAAMDSLASVTNAPLNPSERTRFTRELPQQQ